MNFQLESTYAAKGTVVQWRFRIFMLSVKGNKNIENFHALTTDAVKRLNAM